MDSMIEKRRCFIPGKSWSESLPLGLNIITYVILVTHSGLSRIVQVGDRVRVFDEVWQVASCSLSNYHENFVDVFNFDGSLFALLRIQRATNNSNPAIGNPEFVNASEIIYELDDYNKAMSQYAEAVGLIMQDEPPPGVTFNEMGFWTSEDGTSIVFKDNFEDGSIDWEKFPTKVERVWVANKLVFVRKDWEEKQRRQQVREEQAAQEKKEIQKRRELELEIKVAEKKMEERRVGKSDPLINFTGKDKKEKNRAINIEHED